MLKGVKLTISPNILHSCPHSLPQISSLLQGLSVYYVMVLLQEGLRTFMTIEECSTCFSQTCIGFFQLAHESILYYESYDMIYKGHNDL